MAVSRRAVVLFLLAFPLGASSLLAETLLLRQPAVSAEHIAFVHGSDLWVVDRDGGDARRLTSTPGVEGHPQFSPDGKTLAFASDRAGASAVYTMPLEGGAAQRLTWYPAGAVVRGFSRDGSQVLYASSRQTAPTGYNRLWTVPIGGGPSTMIATPFGHDGAYSPDGSQLAVDRTSRWDVEWRNYRGGQNRPLMVLDLESLEETEIPAPERSTDIQPVWLGETIYFLSDRAGGTMNVWSYEPATSVVAQVTKFRDVDVKALAGHGDQLVIERAGQLHALDPSGGKPQALDIRVRGDFPWQETRWEDVSSSIRSASLSPTGKRALFEARGEIFTVPVEKGSPRNLTRSPGSADRMPVWSPDGQNIAWFSDAGDGYSLHIGSQDGLTETRSLSIGESKMAWGATWSPDGKSIAFVDDDVRVRVLDVESGDLITADTGGTNLERSSMGLEWSPDSKYLAYSKTFPNSFRRAVVWSVEEKVARPVTDAMADVTSPVWDRSGKHLYLLASTDLALGSGWANTSTMNADPSYAPYAVVLAADGETPFVPESDEEPAKGSDAAEGEENDEGGPYAADSSDEEAPPISGDAPAKKDGPGSDASQEVEVKIDFDGIQRRIVALPLDPSRFVGLVAGPAGSVFLAERMADGPGLEIHKFDLKEREAKSFSKGVRRFAVSADGKKMLVQSGPGWKVIGTGAPAGFPPGMPPSAAPPGGPKGQLDVSLQMSLDRRAEWRHIFEEAWRYLRDFFYDPGLHGRNWDDVRKRYEPLVDHVRHRSDLNYLLDQMSGELSVGHSFVFGGDVPDTDSTPVGLLGADFEISGAGWKIARIYTFESWNPGIKAPLDRPGLGVEEGQYLVGVNGRPLTASQGPYELLNGTANQQTTLHIHDEPQMEGSTAVTVEPIASENALRRRAWIEDNRRRVDELSDGRLAYVWVPNTGGPGMTSFNRYFFAQQDKEGAVIDERFNGGGLLDDYMVDLMTRKLRAAITNEVPDGRPIRLPAGILGPKVLLINEYAGSGGDFFPWVFRQQRAGQLIGARTWGGLVKSSVHYPLIDGGAMTAPDNAVFDPIDREWIGENVGIPPDIEVHVDSKSTAEGRDLQLERGVAELLRILDQAAPQDVRVPEFPSPAKP